MRLASSLCALVLASCAAETAAPARVPAAANDAASSTAFEPCALKVERASSGERSTSRLPPDLYARALAPVTEALCECTHGDDETRIDVRIAPADGEVRASAPDDARIDACLSEHLRPGRFTRFDPPAGVEGAVSAPARMAPARPGPVEKFRAKMRPGAATPPAPPPAVVLVYSLTLDRAHEMLRDSGGAHVPAVDDR